MKTLPGKKLAMDLIRNLIVYVDDSLDVMLIAESLDDEIHQDKEVADLLVFEGLTRDQFADKVAIAFIAAIKKLQLEDVFPVEKVPVNKPMKSKRRR